jgi:hypothetical protein
LFAELLDVVGGTKTDRAGVMEAKRFAAGTE